jgi:hypothetical protein
MSSRYGRSVNAVHAPRIVMEERRLLRLGDIAGDRLETIEDRVEARSYAPTGKSLRTSIDRRQSMDAMKRNVARAFGRRGWVIGRQRRNLDLDVGR